MKNNNLAQYVALCFLALSTYSCEKMVEADLPANQISSSVVFNDIQTADAALAAVYAGLWNNSPLSGDRLGSLAGIYTDDLDFFALTATDGTYEFFSNSVIPANSMNYGVWSSAYQLIYSCNAVIEGAAASTVLSATDRSRIVSEAVLIRSVLFFYLNRLYGDIPYPVSTDYTVNRTLARVPSENVLQKLEVDLLIALEGLGDTYRHAERVYPNRKVAQLMLAKVYMEQQEWSKAEPILTSVTAAGLYSFQNDINKVFRKGGSHILWQLKPRSTNEATKESYTYYFAGMPPYNYALSSTLMSSFPAGDLRKQHWTAPVTVAGNTWYRAAKYRNISNNTDEYSVVFRLEEVYLLLAESLANQNKIPQALPYVNATRQRAGLTALNTSITKDQLLNEILDEERREFFTEMGHRFLDLKRHSKLGLLAAVKPNWKPYHQMWPVPEKELLLNPNLNPQNPGY